MKKISYIFVLLFFSLIEINAQENNYKEIGLSENEILYLNENLEVKENLDKYIEQSNPLTDENKKFAKDLVALLCEMDYKMPVYTDEDFPGIEDGLPFEWWKTPEKHISFGD